jgi:predicted lipoprotein with Yx(FWY)xxD motif
MRHARTVIAGSVAAVASCCAFAAASPAAGAATVELRQTNRGMILANSEGFTLYVFTSDAKKKDNCVMISGCPEFWPPLTVMGAPSAGPGVKAHKLGTIMLPNGSMQVTYNKHPLYTYKGDTHPEETSYIGVTAFGGTWYGMTAKGKEVL